MEKAGTLTARAAPRHLDYIDALRGFAITGVLATHIEGMFPDMFGPAQTLARFATNGVHLFFMTSALTLMMSWHARQDGASRFWIRRLFRIAPMFWLAILVYAALHASGLWPQGAHDWFDVLLTFMFVHGWSTYAINLVVPGCWTIGAEMTFYLLFPLIATLVTSLPRAVLFVVLSLAVAIASHAAIVPMLEGLSKYDRDNFQAFWFPNTLLSFAIGCLFYFLLPWAPRTAWRANLPRAGIVVLLGYCLHAPAVLWFTSWQSPVAMQLLTPLMCGAFALSLANIPAPFLVNRVTRFIGKVSFSAYLLHFLVFHVLWVTIGPHHLGALLSTVLYLLTCCVVMAVTVAISWLTWRLIERPGVRAGERFIRHFLDPAPAVAAGANM